MRVGVASSCTLLLRVARWDPFTATTATSCTPPSHTLPPSSSHRHHRNHHRRRCSGSHHIADFNIFLRACNVDLQPSPFLHHHHYECHHHPAVLCSGSRHDTNFNICLSASSIGYFAAPSCVFPTILYSEHSHNRILAAER